MASTVKHCVFSAARRAWSLLAAAAVAIAWTIGPLAPSSPSYAIPTTSALSLRTSSDSVQVPDALPLRVTSSLTVEAWAKPVSVVAGLNGVVSKPGYALALQPIDNGFAVVLLLAMGGTSYTASTFNAGPLALGHWYHLAGTYDGHTMRVFVNGTELANLVQVGSLDVSQAPLRVGTLEGSSIHLVGEIDEVRVSDIARYSTNFAPSATPFVTDTHTRGLWHFDEGSGATTADASGNGDAGQLVGNTGWALDSPVGGSTAAPTITNVATSNVESGTASVTWTTDKASDSQVSYGTSVVYAAASPKDPSMVTTHTVKLDGLQGRTPYDFQVVSIDAFGNRVASGNFSFTTADPSSASARLGEWSAAENWPAVAVHSALLYTGDVLTWDAWETNGTPSVRLWHPSTQTFTSVPNLVSQIFCSGHVSLADGRLLVVGGHAGEDTGSTDTNIFDPATSTWSVAPRMAEARWYPSATRLFDGRVLAFSGEMTQGIFANRPEIYTPATNSWSSLNVDTSDFQTDQYPLSYQLPNGKLFALSPSSGVARAVDAVAQTYSPALSDSTLVRNGTAIMYRPGKILFTGGGHPLVGPSSETSAEVVDLTQIDVAWRSTKPMALPRTFHNLVSLPDGKVLAVGGGDRVDNLGGGQLAAESWDPGAETWTTLAAERDPREYHSTSVLLPDGRVLVAGGGRFGVKPDFYSAEIYSPPYLFKGPRPSISAAPAAASYGDNLAVATPDASNITSVVLTGLGSVTHTLDMDQRYVELGFTRTAAALTVTAPPSATLAPPGYYMLWLVNSSGVPSVSRMVKLGGASAAVQPPVVAVGGPTPGANVFGSAVDVSVIAASSVGINQVQVYLDNQPLGAPLSSAPYALSWDTTRVPNGSHQLQARTTDAYGDLSTSVSVNVNVLNIPPPVVALASASNVTQIGAVINWTTDEATAGVVQYGPMATFGSLTSMEGVASTSHSQALSGLAADTVYVCEIVATNAIGGRGASSVFTFRTQPLPVPPSPPPSGGGGGGGGGGRAGAGGAGALPGGGGGGAGALPGGGAGGAGASAGGGGGAGALPGGAAAGGAGGVGLLLAPPLAAPPPIEVDAARAAGPPSKQSVTPSLMLAAANVALSVPPQDSGLPVTAQLALAPPDALQPLPDRFEQGDLTFSVALQDAASAQPLAGLRGPLSLTVSLAAADLDRVGGDIDRLHLAHWTGSAWEGLACSADAMANTLACDTSRVGVFAVLIAPPPAGPLDFDVPGGHFYKQANGFGSAGDVGFAVVDDAQASMWSEMNRLGGVDLVGYPISGRFTYRGFLTQAFQKLVLQWRPELGRAAPVNVYDDLNQRGTDAWLADRRQTPPAMDTSADAGKAWDDVVARHQAMLDAYAPLRDRYAAIPNASETLGLPLAVHDYGPLVSVRLQRATLQVWKADTPWAAAGSVVVGNGGDVAKDAGLWPADATAPTPAPPPAISPVD